jgi:retron-type reverse transcriptase
MERWLRNMKDTQGSESVLTVQQRIAEQAWERPQECFTALNLKRVHIPKGDGKETRGSGRPTIEDKVMQRANA